MARCPYGAHRLVLTEDLTCNRCGEDLRLYVTARDIPVTFYNKARCLWNTADWDNAELWLQMALSMRFDFAEAHWLLGAVAIKRQRPEQARYHLLRARELGVKISPDWLPEGASIDRVPQAIEEASKTSVEEHQTANWLEERGIQKADGKPDAIPLSPSPPLNLFKRISAALANLFGHAHTAQQGKEDVPPNVSNIDLTYINNLVRATVQLCQKVHLLCAEAIIAPTEYPGTDNEIIIAVAVPDEETSAVSEAVEEIASEIEANYNVTIRFIARSQVSVPSGVPEMQQEESDLSPKPANISDEEGNSFPDIDPYIHE